MYIFSMDRFDHKAVGLRIQQVRKKNKLNQTELGDAAGFTQPAISAIEKGDQPVTIAFADWFSKRFDLSVNWILYGGDVKSIVAEKEESYSTERFDWDLHNEIAAAIAQIQNELNVMIRPDKLGGLIRMIYNDEISGVDVPRAKIIELVRLAA